MAIGNRILLAFELSGKSPASLAKHLETKQSTISGWCKDGKIPASDKILPICEFLGISPLWLLSGEGPVVQAWVNGAVCIDANAREFLKKLAWMFTCLKKSGMRGENPFEVMNYDESDNEKKKVADNIFFDADVTRELLHEWSVSNFEVPPSKKQLKFLFNFYRKEIAGPSYLDFENRIDEIETAINDYIFYIEGKKSDDNQIAAAEKVAVELGVIKPGEDVPDNFQKRLMEFASEFGA
ncbi:MAG: helix-turn-helix domain-containing protein [Defluviitaleaceae bacterium]|nr:helix-turn-helix domain-containing protein [Defluviitaleaceae bacterium]